jgi:hypothetical protein
MPETLQEYGCVKCQETHFSNQSIYREHIDFQSKHGIKTHVHQFVDCDEWSRTCWCGEQEAL